MEGEQLLLFPFNDYDAPKNQVIIDFDGAKIEAERNQKQAQNEAKATKLKSLPDKIGSVREAAIIAIANGYAKKADFSELDAKTAEIMLRTLNNFYRKFPAVTPVDFISDKSRVDDYSRKRRATAIFNKNPVYYRGIYPMYSDSGIIAKIAVEIRRKKRSSMHDNALMSVTYFRDKRAFLFDFNPLYLENGEIVTPQGEIISGKDTRYHPIKSFTVRGSINHELGHVLTFCLNAKNDRFITHLYRSLAQKKAIALELSEYAKTNCLEFIAEAWSEYTTSPNPRPVAREVGGRLEELYAQKYHT